LKEQEGHDRLHLQGEGIRKKKGMDEDVKKLKGDELVQVKN